MFGKKQCRRDEETVPAALFFQKGNCSVLPFPMEIPGRGYDSLQVIILGHAVAQKWQESDGRLPSVHIQLPL